MSRVLAAGLAVLVLSAVAVVADLSATKEARLPALLRVQAAQVLGRPTLKDSRMAR